MKKAFSLILLFVICMGLLASPVVAQQSQFAAPRLVVNSSFLNVRSGPGVQYSIMLTVVGGTELPVLGRASDNVWYQVSTVIGVGWVNVQFTVPRGSFDNVPVISLSDIAASVTLPGTPSTLGLGQGGGAAPSTTAGASGSTLRFVISNNRVVTVSPGERFRAMIMVEAVNLRTQPVDGAPALGTLFRDDTNDFSIVGSSRDKSNVDWFALDVPDLGVGWVEAPKVFIRLSHAAGTVMIVVADVVGMVSSPNGSGTGLPVLTNGREGFLKDISKDGKFVKIELGGGEVGWVPFDSVVTRSGTPTDEIDFTNVAQAQPLGQGGGAAPPSQPATFGLDTPHIVVNTGFLNIRSGPGVQFSSVATVPGGTELPVLGIAKDGVWFLVQGSFGQGWVNSEFTVFRGVISAVPIIHQATGVLSNPTAVISGSVTLYAAPGANFGSIGVLTGPIEVPVVARTADSTWVQLSTSVGFGWVVASQVLLRGDTSLIPVVG